MAYTQENSLKDSATSVPAGDGVSSAPHTGEDPLAERSNSDTPRIISERHIQGPRGEDEVEAIDDRGRRWYDLRPDPRGRADLMGLNFTWWVIAIVIIVLVFLPW
jgi:hypothetical protein